MSSGRRTETRKSTILCMRVTDLEEEMIREAAKLEGKSLSTFVREAIAAEANEVVGGIGKNAIVHSEGNKKESQDS